MITDRETFTELTVHLKVASDALLATARHLAVLTHDADCDDHCAGALDELMTMALAMATIERMLHALIDANEAEGVLQAV